MRDIDTSYRKLSTQCVRKTSLNIILIWEFTKIDKQLSLVVLVLRQFHTSSSVCFFRFFYRNFSFTQNWPIMPDSNCHDKCWGTSLHGDLRPTNCQRMGGKMCGWKGKQKREVGRQRGSKEKTAASLIQKSKLSRDDWKTKYPANQLSSH